MDIMEIINISIFKDLNFKLNKNNLTKIKIIMPKPDIKPYHNDYTYNYIDKEFLEEVEKFKKVISRNINKKYLNTFYKNLDNLTVTTEDIKKEKNQVLEIKGCYYHHNNKVLLSKKRKPDTIYHELFHVSSTQVYNGNKYSGLSQTFFYKGKWIDIGEGINEGYTQVLTERYFPQKKEALSSYPFEKKSCFMYRRYNWKKKIRRILFY